MRAGVIAVLCIGLIGLSACSRSNAAPEDSIPQAAAVQVVPVAKVTRENLSNDLTLTAEFEPFQQVDVMAKVSGYVRSIKADIGDRVRAGQVLSVLEIPEMEDDLNRATAAIDQADAEVVTASDQLRQAEAAHELAHLSSMRIADVIKKEPGLVPRQEVDEAHSRDLVSEAQVSAAKSALRVAEQRARVARTDETRVETLRKYTTIAAPFDGVVTKRYANEGALIQAGTSSQTQAMPVVQLSQNNLLRLILPVPESAVARVRIGESVDVHVATLNRTFAGRVARFADKIQPSTRTMDTEVDVANPQLTLIPGMYAEVILRVDGRDNALSIPLDAIDRSGPATRVYTISSQGTVHIASVLLGLENDRRAEVKSGLQEGDSVIVGRRAGLKEGQVVESKPAETR